ncbi:MAG: hypothetical protein Q6373_015715 [Candidatus Sigynarchaeota archaeon]
MVSTRSKAKRQKSSAVEPPRDPRDPITSCSRCHRMIPKGEPFSKNYITNEIYCEDCEEELILADGNLLSFD